MKLNLFIRLHFVITLPLVILSGVLLTITHSPTPAQGSEMRYPPTERGDVTIDFAAPDMQLHVITNTANPRCDDPTLAPPVIPAGQYYGRAIPLLEEVGGSAIELLPAYAAIPSTFQNKFGPFKILKEGDIYYLWIGSNVHKDSNYSANPSSIEQRFESLNGLVWCNRTNTNLSISGAYKYMWGLRSIIKNGNTYEGWEEYLYEVSAGWGQAIRYVTSTNGISWTVVNQPALVGSALVSVVNDKSMYEMWIRPDADSSFYNGSRALRYRTSSTPGSGWGNWQTGGIIVKVIDGTNIKEVDQRNRVRRFSDGTYELFYREGSYIKLATGTNGITFTTQISNLLDISQTLPITSLSLDDFDVVDVGGEDWFYLTYCTQVANPYCISSHIAVTRPIHRSELTLTKSVTPTTVHPGDVLTYTLTFSNTGPDTASGVVLTDILPSALTNPVVNSNVAITDTGSLLRYVWRVQNLPPGINGVITITAKVTPTWNSGINFTNIATITTTAIETDTSNNAASATSSVTRTATLRAYAYLPAIISKWPPVTFPIHIGDAIPRRPVHQKGEIFYSQTIQLPDQLPSGGHFYFSTRPDLVTKVLVDDQVIVLLNKFQVFAYDFSTSGSAKAALVEMPRTLIQQLAGKTVTIQYRDLYDIEVKATDMWLIWVP
ncbi:MAG: DUF11 domain-containing protein [Anaerolineae bacterium]|nr:DUF11 domain-containing protein [Anaerolineae bacterium]